MTKATNMGGGTGCKKEPESLVTSISNCTSPRAPASRLMRKINPYLAKLLGVEFILCKNLDRRAYHVRSYKP